MSQLIFHHLPSFAHCVFDFGYTGLSNLEVCPFLKAGHSWTLPSLLAVEKFHVLYGEIFKAK